MYIYIYTYIYILYIYVYIYYIYIYIIYLHAHVYVHGCSNFVMICFNGIFIFFGVLSLLFSLFFQFYVNFVFSFCFARHRPQTIVNCQHASGKRDLISCKRDLRQCTIFLPRNNFLHFWHTILSIALCTIVFD